MELKLTAWVTLAALIVYIWMVANAGKARGTYKVQAPSMDGPIAFQSAQRVQANTVEQMVLFSPALWLCAIFLSDRWAAAGGAVWVIGRIVYALAYYKEPSKRSAGFGITALATLALVAGAATGLIMH